MGIRLEKIGLLCSIYKHRYMYKYRYISMQNKDPYFNTL